MTTLVRLLKLLYPFLQEFGLKEVNIREFIARNKTLSYMLLICILMFVMFIYALEQAHLRLQTNVDLTKSQSEIAAELKVNKTRVEQLEIMCETNAAKPPNSNTDYSVESALKEIMGKDNEK